MYSFLFDRRSFVLLVAGIGLAGVLLFVGGLLIGVQWGLPSGTAQAAVCPPAPAVRPARQSAEPARPCIPLEPSPVNPEWDERGEEAGADPEAVPLAEPSVVAAALTPPPPSAIPEPAVQEPLPQPAAVAAPTVTPEANAAFTIQVGAFSRPENLQKVMQDLEGRGYAPYVVELSSGRRRVLHMVRIGRYADRDEATRAASDFRQRERMAAIVQPLG